MVKYHTTLLPPQHFRYAAKLSISVTTYLGIWVIKVLQREIMNCKCTSKTLRIEILGHEKHYPMQENTKRGDVLVLHKPSSDFSSSSTMFHSVFMDVTDVADRREGISFPASTNSCQSKNIKFVCNIRNKYLLYSVFHKYSTTN